MVKNAVSTGYTYNNKNQLLTETTGGTTTTYVYDNNGNLIRKRVGGTPTIFINGLKLADRSLDGYHNRIDSLLASEGKTISRAK